MPPGGPNVDKLAVKIGNLLKTDTWKNQEPQGDYGEWDRDQIVALISTVCESFGGAEIGCDQRYSLTVQMGNVQVGSDIGMAGLEMAVAGAAGAAKALGSKGTSAAKGVPYTSSRRFDDEGHPVDKTKLSTDEALDAAEKWVGKGYSEDPKTEGRFISKDGTRVARMGDSDITGAHGGGPHMNFEKLVPNPAKPKKFMVVENRHVYIE